MAKVKKPQKTAKKRKKPMRPFQDEHGRFKPGNRANPGGRPKGSINLSNKLRQALAQAAPGDETRTIADLLIETGIRQAGAGDHNFWKMIFERIDGKVPDKIEHQYGPNWRLTFEADPEEGDND
jgi:hypothetical protein